MLVKLTTLWFIRVINKNTNLMWVYIYWLFSMAQDEVEEKDFIFTDIIINDVDIMACCCLSNCKIQHFICEGLLWEHLWNNQCIPIQNDNDIIPAVSSDVETRREKGLGAPPEAGSYMMTHNCTWRWPSSVVYSVCI